jgi:hypothetical protein
MVTELDRGHPHRDNPVDVKCSQVYVLHNHLEVVEDLTFLQDPGRLAGPENRKARRVFDWDYGMLDTKGERGHDRRGQDRDATSGRAETTMTMREDVATATAATGASPLGRGALAAGVGLKTASAPTVGTAKENPLHAGAGRKGGRPRYGRSRRTRRGRKSRGSPFQTQSQPS